MLGMESNQRRIIDESGMVNCPYRRVDMEVERCVSCPLLASMGVARDGLREVRCRLPVTDPHDDRLLGVDG